MTDAQVFDTTNVTIQEWANKDRTVVTLRLSDKDGISDMKVYLSLKERVEQYEIMLNIQPEHEGEH